MDVMSFITPDSIKKARELDKNSTHSFPLNKGNSSVQSEAREVLKHHAMRLKDITLDQNRSDVAFLITTITGDSQTFSK